jgi:chlorophyll synthase
MPEPRSLLLAGLYSIGAHGIMTLNDFKSIEGDRRMGVDSLPVLLGVDRAAWAACITMAVPQLVVVGLLVSWDRPMHAVGVGSLLAVQLVLMDRFLKDARARATWYSALGVNFFVIGMLVSAFALKFPAGAGA